MKPSDFLKKTGIDFCIGAFSTKDDKLDALIKYFDWKEEQAQKSEEKK